MITDPTEKLGHYERIIQNRRDLIEARIHLDEAITAAKAAKARVRELEEFGDKLADDALTTLPLFDQAEKIEPPTKTPAKLVARKGGQPGAQLGALSNTLRRKDDPDATTRDISLSATDGGPRFNSGIEVSMASPRFASPAGPREGASGGADRSDSLPSTDQGPELEERDEAEGDKDPKANASGVYVEGLEVLTIPMPKSWKCRAQIEVIQGTDGLWRWGHDTQSRLGGSSCAPWARDQGCRTRTQAIHEAAHHVASYFRREKEERAAKAVFAWLDKQPGMTELVPISFLADGKAEIVDHLEKDLTLVTYAVIQLDPRGDSFSRRLGYVDAHNFTEANEKAEAAFSQMGRLWELVLASSKRARDMPGIDDDDDAGNEYGTYAPQRPRRVVSSDMVAIDQELLAPAGICQMCGETDDDEPMEWADSTRTTCAACQEDIDEKARGEAEDMSGLSVLTYAKEIRQQTETLNETLNAALGEASLWDDAKRNGASDKEIGELIPWGTGNVWSETFANEQRASMRGGRTPAFWFGWHRGHDGGNNPQPTFSGARLISYIRQLKDIPPPAKAKPKRKAKVTR